jgi:hypothetical protein
MSFFNAANYAQRALETRFTEKELNYALHPAFDPATVATRRVADVAVQHRLGILSQRRFGSYSLDRAAGRFAALDRWIGFSEDDADSPKAQNFVES